MVPCIAGTKDEINPCFNTGMTRKAGRCGCSLRELNDVVWLLLLLSLLCLPFLVRNKLACLRIALERIGSYVLPDMEAYAPVETFDEGGAHSGHVDGQFDFGGRVRVFLGAWQFELDLAHLGLGIFAGEVFAGGSGSRCEGADSQQAKQNVEISGVGGYD